MLSGSELRDIKKVKHTMIVKYGDNLSDLLARFRDANHKQYYELAHITAGGSVPPPLLIASPPLSPPKP